MDFRQLNYFVAVAQELSFSRAAERLHISQPPLSQQIKLLEQDLGVQLFRRTRRTVNLTDAGSMFLEQATTILRQYATARELCALSVDGRAGKLRIAFTASVPIFEQFPRLIQAFRKACPNVEMDLLHLSTGEQLLALNSGDVDIGFLRPSLNFRAPPAILAQNLWHDELMLAVAADHRLADPSLDIGMADLAREDFILFPKALGCGLFEHIATLTAAAGFAPRIVQQVRENSTTLALVAAGLGISIVPGTYTHTQPPGVVFRRMRDAGMNSRIILATARHCDNASVPRFLQHAASYQASIQTASATLE